MQDFWSINSSSLPLLLVLLLGSFVVWNFFKSSQNSSIWCFGVAWHESPTFMNHTKKNSASLEKRFSKKFQKPSSLTHRQGVSFFPTSRSSSCDLDPMQVANLPLWLLWSVKKDPFPKKTLVDHKNSGFQKQHPAVCLDVQERIGPNSREMFVGRKHGSQAVKVNQKIKIKID